MLLAVDIGNTNIVFAVFQGSRMLHTWRMCSNDQRSPDEYAVFLHTHLSLNTWRLSDLSATIIASVAPAALQQFLRFCQGNLKTPTWVVGKAPLDSFIEVKIDQPKQAGADRLVNAYACFQKHGGNAIIVDFGTATTFDLIDEAGHYLGGIIAPGPHVAMQALAAQAAQLYPVRIIKTPPVIGKSSLQAQQSGLYWGYRGLIAGVIEKIQASQKKSLKVVATGGLASLFEEEGLFHVIDEDLTVRGLAQLAKTFC